jgi:hypothetical protein
MRRAFQALLALFGVIVIVEHKRVYITLLAGVFFVGGIGRLLAVLIDGAPHPFYVAMLVLELALPPLMVVVATRVAEPVSA